MKIIRVTKNEFETEDNQFFPIIPPLEKEINIKEFQKLYDKSHDFIKSIEDIGCDDSNTS